MALIDSGPRMFTAIVGESGSTIMRIPVDYVEKIVKESHPLIKILIKRMMMNLRER